MGFVFCGKSFRYKNHKLYTVKYVETKMMMNLIRFTSKINLFDFGPQKQRTLHKSSIRTCTTSNQLSIKLCGGKNETGFLLIHPLFYTYLAKCFPEIVWQEGIENRVHTGIGVGQHVWYDLDAYR